MSESTSLTKFMNTRYRDYTLYVLYSRAIPSVVDGLKPSQRKVVWTANKVAQTKMKTAALAGAVTEKANYHHGSTDGVASLMAGTHKNNIPLLTGEGNFGSRLVPEYSAPRYTYVKISKDFKKYFCDDEILLPSEDPEDPEPRYYLPLIPWVLINGVEGIAYGYATEIQPRNPRQITELCRDYISGKKTREEILDTRIPPYFEGFRGEVLFHEGRWICRGLFSRKSASKIEITELPIGVIRLKYIEFLDKLKEQKKISSYEEGKTPEGFFNVTVRFPSTTDLDSLDVVKFLRLEKTLSENITTIDETFNLKIFNSAAELLLHFCDFRLSKYTERFVTWKARDEALAAKIDLKRTFIEMVLNGEIEFKGNTKKQLREKIAEKFAEKSIKVTNDNISQLLEVKTYEFCQDEIEDIDKKHRSLLSDIKRWESADNSRWYSSELDELLR